MQSGTVNGKDALTRRTSYSLTQIVDWWKENWRSVFPACYDLGGEPTIHGLHPHPKWVFQAEFIGWGEPFCFRCGWLAPVEDGVGWEVAAGWLEKAHIHDLVYGGMDEPANIALLCPGCHDSQPGQTRTAGLAYITDGARVSGHWQLWSDGLGMRRKGGRTREAYYRRVASFAEAAAVAGISSSRYAAPDRQW